MESKIIATVSGCVQVGTDSYRDVHKSRVFSTNKTIDDILSWARDVSGKPTLSLTLVQFSEYSDDETYNEHS